MRAVDIIRAKRDGEALSREAIESFVRGVTDGSWEDYQSSALLMAIVLKGMNAENGATMKKKRKFERHGVWYLGWRSEKTLGMSPSRDIE